MQSSMCISIDENLIFISVMIRKSWFRAGRFIRAPKPFKMHWSFGDVHLECKFLFKFNGRLDTGKDKMA